MSCDGSTSLLCKNTFWPLEILSSSPTFPIWSSRHFCTTTHLNISLKILPNVWRCQWMHTIHLQAKTQCCPLKNLSGSASFAFWYNLMICTATPLYFALIPLSFFLPIALPTKSEVQEIGLIGGFEMHVLNPFSFCPKLEFCKTCTIYLRFLPNKSYHHLLHLKRHWSGDFGHSKSYLSAYGILSNTWCAQPLLAS